MVITKKFFASKIGITINMVEKERKKTEIGKLY